MPTTALQAAIQQIHPLSQEGMQVLLDAWEYQSVPANAFLVRRQQVSDYIYFIDTGIVRIFYEKNDKEVTEWIAMDKSFCLSITSFFERRPSHLLIHTIVPSGIFGVHHNKLMALAEEYHEIETLLRKMVTRSLILSQERMYAIQFETARQRYHRLAENHPGILQKVPLSYIASFLGITPETLSRIRGSK